MSISVITVTGHQNLKLYCFTRRHPFLIGVAGGTASGKTTVCDLIMQRLQDQCIVMLSQVRVCW